MSSVSAVLAVKGIGQHAHTPFGFTGLRGSWFCAMSTECSTGLYIPGNSYRIFNAVLMRFLSPDRASPTGPGGVNAYCYCMNDPINRIDPTGHASILRRLQALLPNRGSPVLDLQQLGEGAYFFLDKGGRRGNVLVHGLATADSTSAYVKINHQAMPTVEFVSQLKSLDFDKRHVRALRVVSCGSADGSNPLAQQIAMAFQLPTKGYRGSVDVNYTSEFFDHLWTSRTNIRQATITPMHDEESLFFRTRKSLNRGYSPQHFNPTRA